MWRGPAGVVLAAGLCGASLVVAAPAEAAVSKRLRTAISDLPVAAETRAGYERSKFRLWVDADRDCRNTRAEVLAAESTTKVNTGCSVSTGTWFSYYDRVTWTKASDVDIDHLVPLAEAWDSGAKRWNADTRRRYANDLDDRRTLIAVTDNVNQTKADKDPAHWLPRYGRCVYVQQWVAVKIRWSLKVDVAEKKALAKVAKGCTNTQITVTRAKITRTTTVAPAPSGGGTDPRFDYCYQAKDAGYGPYYRDTDAEYEWYRDADSDGIVCE